jgi:hypothetical protein
MAGQLEQSIPWWEMCIVKSRTPSSWSGYTIVQCKSRKSARSIGIFTTYALPVIQHEHFPLLLAIVLGALVLWVWRRLWLNSRVRRNWAMARRNDEAIERSIAGQHTAEQAGEQAGKKGGRKTAGKQAALKLHKHD